MKLNNFKNKKSAFSETTILMIVDLIYLVFIIVSLISITVITFTMNLDSTDYESNTYPIYIATRCFQTNNYNLTSSLISWDLNSINQTNFNHCFYFGASFPLGLNLTIYNANKSKKIKTLYYDKPLYVYLRDLTSSQSSGGSKEINRTIPIILNDNGKLINALAIFDMLYPNS